MGGDEGENGGRSTMTEEERWNAAARDILSGPGKWRAMDLIWVHPNGGKLFLGDAMAAQSRDMLAAHGITHVINCTQDLPNYHQHDADLTYYRFVISGCWRLTDVVECRKFFQEPLQWMEQVLASGNHLLSHCLAGAHRSAMNVALYLYLYWKQEEETIYDLIRRRRPIAQPTLYAEAMRKMQLWVHDPVHGVAVSKD